MVQQTLKSLPKYIFPIIGPVDRDTPDINRGEVAPSVIMLEPCTYRRERCTGFKGWRNSQICVRDNETSQEMEKIASAGDGDHLTARSNGNQSLF